MTLNSLAKYGKAFQVKVISALLTDKKFLQTIQDVLSDVYFDAQADKWIIREIIKYFEKYATTITMDALKIEMRKLENEILQTAVKEQLRDAYQASSDDLKYVEEEFSAFLKNQQLKKALLQSVDLLDMEDYDSIRTLIDTALKAGNSKDIGHEYEKKIEDRYREEERNPIATPWGEINQLLQGGLGNGDLGIVFGNPGGGKSWTMVALAGHAIEKGYNVIYYSLELAEEYVGRRFDAYFTKTAVNNILAHREQVEKVVPHLKGKLIIKEYAPGKATMNTIESHIQKCEDGGFKADLVIIDYLDLLTTKKSFKDQKQGLDSIYVGAKGLAREMNIPIWSVSQVNRAGAQDNVIEGDKAAGSYNKMMITDFCMSLSRKKEDKQNGTGRFHVMKNRYGMDGMTFNAYMDASIGDIKFTDDDFSELESKISPNDGLSDSEKNAIKGIANNFFMGS